MLGLSVLLFAGATLAFAESNDDDDDDNTETTYSTLEEIKAEPYNGIAGKWEVEIEFEEDEYTVYVYEVEDEADLFEKIASKIESEFDFEITADQVESKADVDEDGFEEVDEDEDSDEGSDEDEDKDDFSGDVTKIEAEQYNGIDGKWKIEVNFEDEDAEFYLYNIDDKAELTSSVRTKVNSEFDKNYSEEKISSLLEIDDESDFDDSESDDDSDKDDDKDDDKPSTSMSDDERSKKIADLQAQLEKLIKLVMQLLSLQLGQTN